MDMADIDPIEVSNLDIYGNAPLEWSRAREQLARWHGPDVSHFLCTTRPDGQPHVAGVGAMWLDGDLYIVSGDGTRKSKNLAIHPACSIAVRLPGIDVTLEGTAAHVTDAQTLDRVAALYRQLGWPADVDAAARAFTAPFSAPSAGRPPWQLYRFVFHTAFGVASQEPFGATRWRFARS
jgi:Pyridoxamine 5'-phosphate oxidase